MPFAANQARTDISAFTIKLLVAASCQNMGRFMNTNRSTQSNATYHTKVTQNEHLLVLNLGFIFLFLGSTTFEIHQRKMAKQLENLQPPKELTPTQTLC